MTHEQFNSLYNDGKITLKIYSGTVDGVEKCIEAFEYDGKFYLRIHSAFKYVTGRRSNGKRYGMTRESHYIKEFESREHANNYFKKASEGLVRIS